MAITHRTGGVQVSDIRSTPRWVHSALISVHPIYPRMYISISTWDIIFRAVKLRRLQTKYST